MSRISTPGGSQETPYSPPFGRSFLRDLRSRSIDHGYTVRLDGIGIAEECNGSCRISADFFPARVRLEQLCGSFHFGSVPAVYLQLISSGLDRYAGRTPLPFDGRLLSGSFALSRTTHPLLSDYIDADDSGLNYAYSHFYYRRSIGWLDTYWALIVPALFNAFGIFYCDNSILACHWSWKRPPESMELHRPGYFSTLLFL